MEFLGVTSTGWVAITIALSMSILAGMMFVLGRERFHYAWGIFCVAVAIWSAAFYFVTLANDAESARFWWKFAYIGIILNPFTFTHFTVEFVNNRRINEYKTLIVALLYIVAFIFVGLNLTTNLIVNEVTFLFGELYYNTPPAILHPYFMSSFLGLVAISFYLVAKAYKQRSDDKLFRQRVPYFFIAALIGFIGGSMNFLAVYEIQISPITNFSVAAGAAIIAYAILRYRLFDARVVMAQLLTFILISFAVVRLVVSDSIQWIVFNSLLLLVTVFVGLYLIKSVRREVEQREKLEILTNQLEEANEQLKMLDKARAEFIAIANHQLRSPPTTIKWYLSGIMAGEYGKLTPKLREAIEKTQLANNALVALIEDMLNVSRIERGKLEFIFDHADLAEIVEGATQQLLPLAKMKALKLVYHRPKEKLPLLQLDREKIRQVVNNLIDNAIKYTSHGAIEVFVERKGKELVVRVRDTGKGILPQEQQVIFEKFGRGKDAVKYAVGLGLGLYVAKVIVEEHKGRIWAESAGESKGSTFAFALPLHAELKPTEVIDLTKQFGA